MDVATILKLIGQAADAVTEAVNLVDQVQQTIEDVKADLSSTDQAELDAKLEHLVERRGVLSANLDLMLARAERQ